MNQATKKESTEKTANALGQYAGYALQNWRFLHYLLDCSNEWNISLEVFEDVGAESPNGDRIASQTKRTKGQNPVSDLAPTLWKAFYNWINSIDQKILTPQTTVFEIYVSQSMDAPLATQLNNALTPEEAESAIKAVKAQLSILKTKSKKTKTYIASFCAADMGILIPLVQNFRLKFGSGDIVTETKNKIAEKWVEEDILEDLLKYSLGTIDTTIMTAADKNELPIMNVGAFKKDVLTYRNKLKSTVLNTLAKSPNQEDITNGLLKKYVRQLDLIEADESDKLQAIRDFFQASADRSYWSEKGLIHDSSFDDFESNLIRTWKNLKTKAILNLSNASKTIQGKAVYVDCSLHREPLQGITTPGNFTIGSYHSLSDQEIVGWHPEYDKILNESKLLEDNTNGDS
jgi:hypothetical protein